MFTILGQQKAEEGATAIALRQSSNDVAEDFTCFNDGFTGHTLQGGTPWRANDYHILDDDDDDDDDDDGGGGEVHVYAKTVASGPERRVVACRSVWKSEKNYYDQEGVKGI